MIQTIMLGLSLLSVCLSLSVTHSSSNLCGLLYTGVVCKGENEQKHEWHVTLISKHKHLKALQVKFE